MIFKEFIETEKLPNWAIPVVHLVQYHVSPVLDATEESAGYCAELWSSGITSPQRYFLQLES